VEMVGVFSWFVNDRQQCNSLLLRLNFGAVVQETI